MTPPVQISRESVNKTLVWKDVISAVREAMLSVTQERAFFSRSITNIPETKNKFFSMPGYLRHEHFGALGCKLVTSFPSNSKKKLPSILANIFLFNEDTGELEAILDGTEITLWRTAAASVVATQYLRDFNVNNNILAVIGAGEQAKIHVYAFQEIFDFHKVHIWNRNHETAEALCSKLNSEVGKNFTCTPFKNPKDCVQNADVIITTTYSSEPLIKCEWLKKGVHINAVGVGHNVMELDENTYKSSSVFVDHIAGIEHELKHLTDKGIRFEGEIGSLIDGTAPPASPDQSTIFQSLGMAVEDCAVAKMVYKKYMKAGPIGLM